MRLIRLARHPLIHRARIRWWKTAWRLIFLIWSPGVVIRGGDRIPPGPVIFAANHNSHADTAALQVSLAELGHDKVLTAGAEDYFFTGPLKTVFALFLGVFPFPRSGAVGVERSRSILEEGWSVLIYPQGTRDGGRFRPGVGHLAGEDHLVIPVTIVGTGRMLPKGSFWPRRSPVEVSFGTAMTKGALESPAQFASRLEDAVLARDLSALW